MVDSPEEVGAASMIRQKIPEAEMKVKYSQRKNYETGSNGRARASLTGSMRGRPR